jgi:hypothetical protein
MLVVGLLTAAGTALGVVHVEAGRVVDAKWNDRLRAEVTEIATAAAVRASRDAVTQVVREEIGPLRQQVDQHIPKDDALGAELRATVASCCAVMPRWTPTTDQTPRIPR